MLAQNRKGQLQDNTVNTRKMYPVINHKRKNTKIKKNKSH